jgi:hypothetical protein
MAARNTNYDFLIKLLLIGDSGANRSMAQFCCMVRRFYFGRGREELPSAPFLGRFVYHQFHYYHRVRLGMDRVSSLCSSFVFIHLCSYAQHRFQNPHARARRKAYQVADMGHCWSRAIPHHHHRSSELRCTRYTVFLLPVRCDVAQRTTAARWVSCWSTT